MREGAIRAGGLPALLVVAGVRDHRSLGWAAAEAWLRHGPEHHLLVTVRSSAAQQFAAEQSRAYPGRIAVVSGDWRDPEVAEAGGGVLAQPTGRRRAGPRARRGPPPPRPPTLPPRVRPPPQPPLAQG